MYTRKNALNGQEGHVSASQPKPSLGVFRVGDHVKVADRVRVTNLGNGRIIDIATTPEGLPTGALVRFEHGPVKGVWYPFRSLTRLADFRGNPVEGV